MVRATVLVVVSLCAAQSAGAQCVIRFSGPDAKIYDEIDLAKFVDNEIRPKLSTTAGSFNISISAQCGGSASQIVTFTIDDVDYYVTDIQGHHLMPSEISYQSSPLSLGAGNLQAEILLAPDINSLTLQQVQDLVKTFAFFFAETARFTDIEGIAGNLVKNCTAQWLDYELLLRRWSRISKLALHENYNQWTARGGTNDDLIAPITSEAISDYNSAIRAGKNGPDAGYVDSRDWSTSISVPQPACDAGTR